MSVLKVRKAKWGKKKSERNHSGPRFIRTS